MSSFRRDLVNMFLMLKQLYLRFRLATITINRRRVSIYTIGIKVLVQLQLYSQLNPYTISCTLNLLILLLAVYLIIKTYLVNIRFAPLSSINSSQVLFRISYLISSLIIVFYSFIYTLFIASLYKYRIRIPCIIVIGSVQLARQL